jgi:hypothetical protein
MQKFRVMLMMTVMCASSFFMTRVTGNENNKSIHNESVRGLENVQKRAEQVYQQIDFGTETPIAKEVFVKGYTGYLNLKSAGRLKGNSILSICDFSLSSREKRLWVIDLDQKKLLFNTLVAHGQGTGEEFAEAFSNRENSHQSSLGFYVTAQTYNGDNGYSLKLLGMDKGYNDAALKRAIVMHGADYVAESFIKNNQRLGRSWGCPAVSREMAQPIINTIKNGTCLYIHYPNNKYLASSTWLKRIPEMPQEELIREQYLKSTQRNAVAMATPAPAVQEMPAEKTNTPPTAEYQGVKLAMGNN